MDDDDDDGDDDDDDDDNDDDDDDDDDNDDDDGAEDSFVSRAVRRGNTFSFNTFSADVSASPQLLYWFITT